MVTGTLIEWYDNLSNRSQDLRFSTISAIAVSTGRGPDR